MSLCEVVFNHFLRRESHGAMRDVIFAGCHEAARECVLIEILVESLEAGGVRRPGQGNSTKHVIFSTTLAGYFFNTFLQTASSFQRASW